MKRKTEEVAGILAGLVLYTAALPVALLLDALRKRKMPLWLLRAMTWRKRRKAPGRDDVERVTLKPEEHLILASYEGRSR